jgi:hypothetical protein
MKKKISSYVRFLNLHYTVKKAINRRLKEKALAKILILSYSDFLIIIAKIIHPKIIRIELTEQ